MILMSYDGSDDAMAAIDWAARLMPGAEATVVTVWEPYMQMMARSGVLGAASSYADAQATDAESADAALAVAAEGARRATGAGFVAQARSAISDGGTARTLLTTAGDVDAEAIVMGTRGQGGVKSFLLGSVSHEVVQHADCAVLVVPSPVLVVRRREQLHREAALA